MRAASWTGAVDAVATSAIRDAENAGEFLARARERLGLPIRVLSREQEARYGYLAAVNSTTLRDGYVLDLGGGSLQLVRVADRLDRELGLLAARHGAHERALPAAQRSGQAQAARGAARARRDASSRRRRGSPRTRASSAAGASWASAARYATSPPRRSAPPGCRPTACRAWSSSAARSTSSWCGSRRCPRPSARQVPGIKPARADLILAGAVVVQGVLQAGGFEALETTEAGLREGVFFERLLDPDGRGGGSRCSRTCAAQAC